VIEEAQEIFEYLPLSKNEAEANYIAHLWDAFKVVAESKSAGQPFVVMPFHLLFMLSLQYKALRVAKLFPAAGEVFFAGVGGREGKEKLLNSARSVFDLAFINERTLPELLRLVGVDAQEISSIKKLIDDRNNNLAHAKGGIDADPENRIQQYLDVLKRLQASFLQQNDEVAQKWLCDLTDEDDLAEFVSIRRSENQLCPADFKSGMLLLFNCDSPEISSKEWGAAVEKALSVEPEQSLLLLQRLSDGHSESRIRKMIKSRLKKRASA
jgi:hypothetical protein